MQLGNKSTRNGQKGQNLIKHCFFFLERLHIIRKIRKITHLNWLERLHIKWNHWESLLYLNRERLRPFIIQYMSYDYKNNGKYRTKLKICICPPNQLNMKLINKNIKDLCEDCFQVPKFVNQMTPIILLLWKENKNLQKKSNMQKLRKLVFMKTGFSKKKDHSRKIKPLWRANCFSIDKWCDLYKEMLSYNLTGIKLADLKNLSLFFSIKNKYFWNS